MPKKQKHKLVPDSSVSLGVISRADLRLTPQNKLFVFYKHEVYWPYLRGGVVCFTSPLLDLNGQPFRMPIPVLHKVRAILKKQEEIREQNKLDFDCEDELLNAAYEYSD